jgi:hypothetical protein
LLHKGPDAFLKKIGEEATETVMAAKDVDHGGDLAKLVYEVADSWFHSMIALAPLWFDACRCGQRIGHAVKDSVVLRKRPCAKPRTESSVASEFAAV